MMFRIIGSVVVLALVMGPSAAQSQVRPVQPAAQASTEAQAPRPLFESVRLPYFGRGELYVVDDGELVIQVGGGFGRDPVTGEEVIYDSETVAVPLDAQAVRLVAADGEWFLDRGGSAIRARKLAPSQVVVTHFEQGPEGACQSRSLADFRGWLAIDLDVDSGSYGLVAMDDETGEVFETGIRLREELSSPSAREDAPSTGSCSATCPNGSCNVSCRAPKYPKCFCRTNGTAYCDCVKRSELHELFYPM